MNLRPNRVAHVVCAVAAVHGAWVSDCGAQPVAPVVVDAATVVRYRVTLAGHDGAWTVVPSSVAMEAGLSTDAVPTVSIRALRVAPPFLSCDVGTGFGTVAVGLSSLVMDGAPTTVSLPTTIGTTGLAEFAATGITTSATGTANYQTNGPSCVKLGAAGAPCSGPFNLALVPAGPTGSILSGSVATAGAMRPFSMVFLGSRPLVAGTTWGRLDVRVELVGQIAAGEPSCPADFDQSGDLAVQDIFAFLNAWFAGAPGSDFNLVDGLTVQDIFDFLNAWFAGCP